MSNVEKTSEKLATDDQKIEIQYEFAKAIRKIPFSTAQKILKNKTETRKFIQKICKDLSIPIQSEKILTLIPSLEKYYADVYGTTIDLSEMIFPENCPAYMAFDHRAGNEDEVMEALKKFFHKEDNQVNLYKYRNPISGNINREEEKKVSPRPAGLYVVGHSGEDEPDVIHRKKSYNMAVAEKLIFATGWEYLLLTGFHKYAKGYFMDKKGWTRTSSLWVGGSLVRGCWNDDDSWLYLVNGSVDSTIPNCGPRQLFLV
jgi:hypothetical protein